MTYKEIYEEFCEWSPEHAKMVIDYRPWGSFSIVVWFNKNTAYKVKRYATHKFVMQPVTKEELRKKFGLD